jgi:hypothetical protein
MPKLDKPITRAQLLDRMRDYYNNDDLPTSAHNNLACCIVDCQKRAPLNPIATQFSTMIKDHEARQRAIANANKYLDEAKYLVEQLNIEQQKECRTLMFDIRAACQDDSMKTEDLYEKISALKAIVNAPISASDRVSQTPS